MKVSDLIRSVVLKTNPCWPFSRLNKTPYYLAIRLFLQTCENFPPIRTVYLRSGLAEGYWVPGLSDIDLTVVVGNELTVDEEFEFLCSFWKRYDRLKRLFPMLGELEILNSEHLQTWMRFGLRGYEAQSWKVLYGTDTVRNRYKTDCRRLSKDRIDDALSVYQGYFREKLAGGETPSYLLTRELDRAAGKILRCLRGSANAASLRVAVAPTEPAAMLEHILDRFDETVSRFNSQAIALTDSPQFPVPKDPVPYRGELLNAAELDGLGAWVEGVIRDYHGRVLIVIKSGLNHLELRTALKVLHQVFPDMMPVILTRAMFHYMHRYYDPFEYSHLCAYRQVLFGADPLAPLQPPTRKSIVDYLLSQVPDILAFPQSRNVISLMFPASSFIPREAQRVGERALLLRLYLEEGDLHLCYNQFMAESEKHYPEEIENLRTLTAPPTRIPARVSFVRLKGLARGIHERVEKLAGAGDL